MPLWLTGRRASLCDIGCILSREAEQFLTKRGRMPTRLDVPANPAGVAQPLLERKIIATIFAGEEQKKKWQGLFKQIFKSR